MIKINEESLNVASNVSHIAKISKHYVIMINKNTATIVNNTQFNYLHMEWLMCKLSACIECIFNKQEKIHDIIFKYC